MATVAIDEAICRAVAAGADPGRIALLDNFCWCSPRDPKRLWQLKETARGCYDAAIAYGTPFISGKDSMYNDFLGIDGKGTPVVISIPPTLLISAVGIMSDVRKSITIDLKFPEDLVYALGTDTVKNIELYQAFFQAARAELIASAICVGQFGAQVALMKSAMAGMLGIDATDTPCHIIASVDPKKKQAFERMMDGVGCKHIGVVTETPMVKLRDSKRKLLIHTTLKECTSSYKSTFLGY